MTTREQPPHPERVTGQAKLTGLLLAVGMLGVPGISQHCFGLAMVNEFLRLSRRALALRIPGAFVILCAFVLIRTQGGVIEPGAAWLVAYTSVPAFVAAYTLGRDGAAHARMAVLSLVAGATVHALINAALIYSEHGVAPTTRLFNDVWTGQFWNATGHASLWVLLIGALPFLLFGRAGKGRILVGWLLLGAALWAAAALASRTMLLVLAVSLGLGILFMLRRRGAGMRLVGGGAAALVAVAFLFLLVPVGLLQRLPLVNRLSSGGSNLGEDPRLERWSTYVSSIGSVSSGRGILEGSIGYAHNIWLDAYDSEGFLPFVFLALFGMFFAGALVSLVRKGETGSALLFGGVGVAWFLQASTEPLIYLSPFIFVAGCGIAGAATGLVRHRKDHAGRPGDADPARTSMSMRQ